MIFLKSTTKAMNISNELKFSKEKIRDILIQHYLTYGFLKELTC